MSQYNYPYDPYEHERAQRPPVALGDGQPQPYYTQPQEPPRQAWVYDDAAGWQQQAAPEAPPPQKPKQKGGAARAVSLMLACTLLGFGGGVAANMVNSQGANQTVVYKAPEAQQGGTVPTASNLSTSDIAAIAGQSAVSIVTEVQMGGGMYGNQTGTGAGSGVIISEDGYIITNNHVIEGASRILVTLPDGSEHEATLVGTDEQTDVAVLKINVSGLTPAVVGDSDNLRLGDFCLAIGNPMGTLGGTVTNGIISGTNREVTIDSITMNLLQMDAAVSPGNSGGGLFNANAELIGIVNAKSSGDDVENLGFAIPINDAMAIAQQLIESGYVSRPAMGVTVRTVADTQQAAEAGVRLPGLYIETVNPGSGAHAAGLQPGDRIISADGTELQTGSDLSAIIAEKQVGDSITLVVERDGQQLSVEVVLGEKAFIA